MKKKNSLTYKQLSFESKSFLSSYLCQVQIQEQQGQTVGQVLQVTSPSQHDLQGLSTAQLVQQGELTEEQQQQVQNTFQIVISSASISGHIADL